MYIHFNTYKSMCGMRSYIRYAGVYGIVEALHFDEGENGMVSN